jgi:hypothetical protein
LINLIALIGPGAKPAFRLWGGPNEKKKLEGPKLKKLNKLGVNLFIFLFFFGRKPLAWGRGRAWSVAPPLHRSMLIDQLDLWAKYTQKTKENSF